MTEITPVLLAGGSGTRLWPVSRKSFPKQFSNLIGKQSLFQESALRFSQSKLFDFNSLIILTSSDFRFIVEEQLYEVGINAGQILIEPETKNTAPAILAACLSAFSENKDSIIIAAPSDHVIRDNKAFYKALMIGKKNALQGKIVTFGIMPSRPETGFGYLKIDKINDFNAFNLLKFIEKPNLTQAEEMLQKGNYFWNSGIFMFRAKDMISQYKKFEPELFERVSGAIKNGIYDLSFFRLGTEDWSKCKDISVDYAIMEKSSNLVTVPLNLEWSDLGDWDAVWREMKPDDAGVAKSKNAVSINCSNSLLRSESQSQRIVGVGVKDIIAIAMPDAVLIAQKGNAQDIKSVVPQLKSVDAIQAEKFPKDHRPWGWFETLVIDGKFQVKRIHVKPGAALSLQSHKHRSEHWVVVDGTAQVTIGEETKLISEGQSVYIPVGVIHRLENPSVKPIVLVEVQFGNYLGEDDIIRYKDIYSRD